MIRAVFFDLDGTLVDRDDACERWLQDFMSRKPEVFPVADRAAALRTFLELDSHGYVDRDEFCHKAIAAFPALDYSADRFWNEFSSGVASSVQPRTIVGRIVEDLAKKYRVAVVTNGSARTQMAKLAAANLAEVLPAFISEVIGFEKPHRRIFDVAAEAFGLRTSEVIFVGDDPDRDIAGASRAGMLTCWISRGRNWQLTRVKPSFTIERIDDLPRLFE